MLALVEPVADVLALDPQLCVDQDELWTGVHCLGFVDRNYSASVGNGRRRQPGAGGGP